MLREVTNESLSEQAYQIVEELIVTLQLAPGRVFTESSLSEDIGIGRTPLREALKRLESQRLVLTIPRLGIMASELSITNQLLILETRRVLDHLIASRAARWVTAEQNTLFRQYAIAIVQSAEAEDLSTYLHVDYEFDELMNAAARNPFAAEAVQPLHVHSRRFWYAYREHGDWVQLAKLHAVLMNQVADGNEHAAAIASDQLLDHLQTFTRALMEAV